MQGWRNGVSLYLHGLDVVAANDVDLDGHCGRHLLHSHTASLGLQTSSLTLSLSLRSSAHYTRYQVTTHDRHAN